MFLKLQFHWDSDSAVTYFTVIRLLHLFTIVKTARTESKEFIEIFRFKRVSIVSVIIAWYSCRMENEFLCLKQDFIISSSRFNKIYYIFMSRSRSRWFAFCDTGPNVN